MPPAPGEFGASPGDPAMPFPSTVASGSDSATAGVPVEPGPLRDDEPGGGPRPTGLHPEQLGFTPRRAVPWLSPVLLSGTAVRVVLAELFGAYLDKRELQSALPAEINTEQPSGAEG